jgi:hypothetical protein
MTDDLDREISRRFEELQRSEAAAVPPFRDLLARPPRERRGRVYALAFALAGAAVLVFAIVVRIPATWPAPHRRQPVSALAALAEWRSPTASLLDTPGHDLLGETPSLEGPLGGAVSAPEAPAARPSPRPEKGASS